MDKIPFQDGTKISSAKVTIDGVDYPVTPARYTGATPLSSVVMNAMQTNIENAIDQNVSNIGGEDYDNTATYEEGDIVKHNGQLYVANQDIDEPEEWAEAHWTATDVLSSAGGNEVAIGDSSVVTSKTKIWIDTDDETDVFSEVVDSLSGNELDKAPSVHAVKQALNDYIISNYSLSGKSITATAGLELGSLPSNGDMTYIGSIIKDGNGIQGQISLIYNSNNGKLYLLCNTAQTFGSTAYLNVTHLYR